MLDQYPLPIPKYCDACTSPKIQLTTNAEVFGDRSVKPDLAIWFCTRCKACVGVFRGTQFPTGYMADPFTRALRAHAHTLFDPIWKHGRYTRTQAYKLLAKELDIPLDRCHIGMLSKDDLRRVIAFAEHYQSEEAAIQRRREEKRAKREQERSDRESVRTRVGRDEDFKQLRARKRKHGR